MRAQGFRNYNHIHYAQAQGDYGDSDRVTVLRDGRTVGVVNTADATSDQLVEMMVGAAFP